MAGGDAVVVVFFAAAVGVAIGLGYRVRQLEERIVQLQSACDGKDFTIVALASENLNLRDIAFGPYVDVGGPMRAQIITLPHPHSDNTLH